MPRHVSLTHAAILPAFVLALVLIVPAPAVAGIGNPIKKAKDAVTKAEHKDAPAAQAKPCAPVVFDDVTVELNEARVARIISTFHKVEAITVPRPGLVEKRNKASDERGAIYDKHGDKIRDLQQKRDDVQGCYHDGYRAATDKKMQEYSQRALSDPKLLEKYKNLAMQNNAAAAAGDTAAQARVNAGIMEEMLPSPEDSAQARKSCGPIPPQTKEEDQIAALDKQIASLDEQIRQIDDKVADTMAKEMALTPAQTGTAIERIRGFKGSKPESSEGGGRKKGDSSSSTSSDAGSSSGSSDSNSAGSSSQCGFTDEEVKALDKHVEELRKYLN
jgi:hypothetical protein